MWQSGARFVLSRTPPSRPPPPGRRREVTGSSVPRLRFQGFSREEQPLVSGSDRAPWDPVTQGQKGKLPTLPLQYTTCQREVRMGHSDPCGEGRERETQRHRPAAVVRSRQVRQWGQPHLESRRVRRWGQPPPGVPSGKTVRTTAPGVPAGKTVGTATPAGKEAPSLDAYVVSGANSLVHCVRDL